MAAPRPLGGSRYHGGYASIPLLTPSRDGGGKDSRRTFERGTCCAFVRAQLPELRGSDQGGKGKDPNFEVCFVHNVTFSSRSDVKFLNNDSLIRGAYGRSS